MRRATWLAAGAVLGVAGYRRLDRAAKSLTTNLDPVFSPRAGLSPPAPPSPLDPRTGPALRSLAGHSVRAAGWLARHAHHARQARRRPAVARGTAGIGGFIGDVRDGMDEYLDRHQANIDRQHRRSGNTLIAPMLATGQRQDHETKDGR